MKTIVIGDLHGDFLGLMAILRATGALDADDRRVPDTRVIQLGDLIHGGTPRSAPRPGVDDVECAALGLGHCDAILIGNHELPHVWPDAAFPTFGGQRPIYPALRAALLAAYRDDTLVPATSVGDWLLTHAGLYPALRVADGEARAVAALLCDRFAARLSRGGRHSVFDWIGPERGGRHEYGGIFWLDWRQLTAADHDAPLRQIVGHTPQEAGYAHLGPYWCCDAGAALSGRVAALTTNDDGATWVPLVVSSLGDDDAAQETGR